MGGKRLKYFDIAKGIGILCVIAGHLGIAGINQIVFTFHMPLFFIISGYFISDKDDIKAYIKKKVWQLLTPYVVTSLTVILGAVVFHVLDTGSADGILEVAIGWMKAAAYGSGTVYNPTLIEVGQIGALWFLLALFLACIEVKFLKDKKYGGLIILFLAYLAWKSGAVVWFPFSIQSGLAAALFVYGGVVLKRKAVFDKDIPAYIAVPGMLMWGYVMIYCVPLSLTQAAFPNGMLDIVTAFVGSGFVVLVSRQIERNGGSLPRIFEFYGKNSLTIMCAHLFELSVVPWTRIETWLTDGLGLPFIMRVWFLLGVKILWATVAVFFVNHIRILKDIFSGQGVKWVKSPIVLGDKKEVNPLLLVKTIAVFCFIFSFCFETQSMGERIWVFGLPVLLLTEGELFQEKLPAQFLKDALKCWFLPGIIIAGLSFSLTYSGEAGLNQAWFVVMMPAVFFALVCFGIAKEWLKEKQEIRILFIVLFLGTGVLAGQTESTAFCLSGTLLVVIGLLLTGTEMASLRKSNSRVIRIMTAGLVCAYCLSRNIIFNMEQGTYSYFPMCAVLVIAAADLLYEMVKILMESGLFIPIMAWPGKYSSFVLFLFLVEHTILRLPERAARLLPIELTPGRSFIIEILIICAVTALAIKCKNIIVHCVVKC